MPRIAQGLLAILAVTFSVAARAQATDPAIYTKFFEVPPGGSRTEIESTYDNVNDKSLIEIEFEEGRMSAPSSSGATVDIRVEAYWINGSALTPIVPIDNYVSAGRQQGEIVRHRQAYAPAAGRAIVPDTELHLPSLNKGGNRDLVVKVTNLSTQESVARYLRLEPLGFRSEVSDSLLLLDRLSVDARAEDAGVEDVSFAPAPGVTYGGVFLARDNRLLRLLQPGVGVNLSFMDWDDRAFDVSSGQFEQGTDSSDIEIGMGIQLSLFRNVVQFTYGYNLHADTDRRYFGVGVSFVDLTKRVKALIPKPDEE